MPNRSGLIVLSIFALLVGMLSGFFVVFNAIFSDIFGYDQHLILFTYTLAVYVILSAILTAIAPGSWRRWIHFLSWPAIAMTALFSLSEWGPRIALNLTYAILVVDGAMLGVFISLKLQRHQKSSEFLPAFMAHAKKMWPILVGLTLIGLVGSYFAL